MPLIQVNDHTFMSQLLGASSVVLDLGAHRGGFSQQLIERYGCRCIAVEANPELCASIPRSSKLEVLNRAVAGSPGQMAFNIYDRLESSSLIARPDRGEPKQVMVELATIPDLIRASGQRSVDLLKVDIEGAEIAALDACPDDVLRPIPQISIEFHDFNGVVPPADARRVVERLRSLGFLPISMWMRSYGDTLFINRERMGAFSPDFLWSKFAVRNWWWFQGFVRRQTGRA